MFRSLAEDQGYSAIGVVLSGTGSDGAVGLKSIKAAGGFTFVQEPSTAKYDGMPKSALAASAPDFCLAPKEIGEELTRIARERPMRRPEGVAQRPAREEDQLAKLFVLVRTEVGNDLSQYKRSTIDRRIERRMTLHKIARVEDYVRYAQQNRAELAALYKDTLIAVTSFFRDPEAFEVLKRSVIPQILSRKEGKQPIRVWVPACATGEEAYSIAICLLEACEDKIGDDRIQIFGTDIDEDCIAHARRGVYPANIAFDVSPDRLNRFFNQKDDSYQVSRRVRDLLVFSKQNLLKDAPFSRIDLVACRNLLIYLQPAAQQRVLRVLHYALNPGGFLFLGTSETVGDAPELFSASDRKSKIYVRKQALPAAFDMPAGAPIESVALRPQHNARPPPSLQAVVDRKVLDLYGPPGVVLSEELDIIQFRGHTGPYLDPAPGAATLNLLRVARFELHLDIKRTLEQAVAEKRRASSEARYTLEGQPHVVRIDVIPLEDPQAHTGCLLVLFQELPQPEQIPVVETTEGGAVAAEPQARRLAEIERELAATKGFLQATIEEKESTLEELKSANEELQSSNEELQSTNEELETSREEMQSTNEELTTVNEELQNRMAELSQTNDDLHNVLAGVDNAIVIVGMDLRIRRYTDAAGSLLNLVPGDLGRSIGFLDSFVGIGALEGRVASVIQSLSTFEEEVLAKNHRWYSFKISPYKTLDHAIRGALVVLIDIDVRRRAAGITRDVGEYAGKFLAAIGHPLLIVDQTSRIVWCNEALLRTFEVSASETVGSPLTSVGGRQLAEPGLLQGLERLFATGQGMHDVALPIRTSNDAARSWRVGCSLVPASTEKPLALISIEAMGEA